jgi:alkylglycerol monooxygenase
MKLNLLAFAVPLFVSFMLLEYYFSIKKNKLIHKFEETIANLNVGIGERISDLLTSGAFFFVFSWIHQHFAFFDIKPTIAT